jgi:hypothetical protein
LKEKNEQITMLHRATFIGIKAGLYALFFNSSARFSQAFNNSAARQLTIFHLQSILGTSMQLICRPARKPHACTKHNEDDANIPASIRGIHFNRFWQICEKLGCTCRQTCRDAPVLDSFDAKKKKQSNTINNSSLLLFTEGNYDSTIDKQLTIRNRLGCYENGSVLLKGRIQRENIQKSY